MDVLDKFELLIFDFDLGNIPREKVYCHCSVDAEELALGIGECEYNAGKVNSIIPRNVGPINLTNASSINQQKGKLGGAFAENALQDKSHGKLTKWLGLKHECHLLKNLLQHVGAQGRC